MATKRPNETVEPDEIGKAHPTGERARDEQREDGGPRYGGGAWEVADERGDQRYGHARNDDADPSELAKGDDEVDDDDTWPGDAASPPAQTMAADDSTVADGGETESSGQRAGVGRGEKPQKPKHRSRR